MVSRCFEAVDVSISLRRNAMVRVRYARAARKSEIEKKKGSRVTDGGRGAGRVEDRGGGTREVNFDTFSLADDNSATAERKTLKTACRGKYAALSISPITDSKHGRHR